MIDKAIGLLSGQPAIETIGCGRTDTGVHASSFYLHVDLEKISGSENEFAFKLNRFLPPDIAVHDIIPVEDSAHARFDASQRTYNYFVHHKKNPFLTHTSTFLHKIPDYQKMNEAANLLLHHTDFASFCKANANNHTTLCKITEAHWKEYAKGWVFIITADRFLRNMVRSVVGTLLEVGYNQIDLHEFERIVQSKSRANAGESVAAHGLFLTDIRYPYINHG